MDTPESHTRRGTAAPGGAHLTRTRHGRARAPKSQNGNAKAEKAL